MLQVMLKDTLIKGKPCRVKFLQLTFWHFCNEK